MTVSTTWVFGYGSLVSPDSLGATLGRSVTPGDGWAEATLHGHGRRWNYGVGHSVGVPVGDAGGTGDGGERTYTIVALGLVVAAGDAVNGVVVAVDPAELGRLDHRERHYDRVDVTALVVPAGTDVPGPTDTVVTYLPRPEAIERYERARDAATAAVERRYRDLVDAAFADLGPTQLERFHRTTPPPDVPVLDLVRRSAG